MKCSVLFLSVFFFYLISSCFPVSMINLFLPHLFLCLCLPSLPFIPFSSSTPSLSLFPLCFSGLPQFVQRRSQFDSVSLVIQGSMEGELNLMDNLSGSICHYYSLPPRPSKHNTNKKVNNRQNDDSLPPSISCVGLHTWHKKMKCSPFFKIWFLKNTKTMNTSFFSFTQARKNSYFKGI